MLNYEFMVSSVVLMVGLGPWQRRYSRHHQAQVCPKRQSKNGRKAKYKDLHVVLLNARIFLNSPNLKVERL